VQNWLESIAQNLVAEFLFLSILLALGGRCPVSDSSVTG
jgi:hypothetical protein